MLFTIVLLSQFDKEVKSSVREVNEVRKIDLTNAFKFSNAVAIDLGSGKDGNSRYPRTQKQSESLFIQGEIGRKNCHHR